MSPSGCPGELGCPSSTPPKVSGWQQAGRHVHEGPERPPGRCVTAETLWEAGPWAPKQESSEGPFALQTSECIAVRASTPGGAPEPWRHLCRRRWWSWCPTANTRRGRTRSPPPQQATRGEQRRDPVVGQGREQSKGRELSCLPWPVPAGTRAPDGAVWRARASYRKAPARSHTSRM